MTAFGASCLLETKMIRSLLRNSHTIAIMSSSQFAGGPSNRVWKFAEHSQFINTNDCSTLACWSTREVTYGCQSCSLQFQLGDYLMAIYDPTQGESDRRRFRRHSDETSRIGSRGLSFGSAAVLLRRTRGIRPCRSSDVVRPGHRRRLSEGIHLVNPFKVNHEMSIRTQELKESASVPFKRGAGHESGYLAHLSP